jgi:hypothetical protein
VKTINTIYSVLTSSALSHNKDEFDSESLARSRVTRMSVVQYWYTATGGDGINLKFAHNINTWSSLLDQLSGMKHTLEKCKQIPRQRWKEIKSNRR